MIDKMLAIKFSSIDLGSKYGACFTSCVFKNLEFKQVTKNETDGIQPILSRVTRNKRRARICEFYLHQSPKKNLNYLYN